MNMPIEVEQESPLYDLKLVSLEVGNKYNLS